MTDRPILFSGPMVRALLDGRKTQTRRIVKLDVPADAHEVFFWSGEALRRAGWANVSEPGLWARRNGRDGYIQHIGRCPYGVPGDRLWVKETWRPRRTVFPWDLDVTYAADGAVRTIEDGEFGDKDWTMPKAAARGNVSPLFMPRWASRLTLTITDVRVERLQDISEADAEAEGIREPSIGPIHMVSAEACGQIDRDTAPALFLWEMLWKSINGDESWNANPWVWAVTFEVERSR